MNSIGQQQGRGRYNGKHIPAHTHIYGPHPNPNWGTHVACTICGMAITKELLPAAINAGAKIEGI